MALELIYTSAPRGLRAGASGYCTVAQTGGLREDLAAALERRSLFAHEPKGESPMYFSFRNLSVGGDSWRVLTRALDAGLDFTGRRHFLAHHLVLEPAEDPPGIQPADLLLGWKGWRDRWLGAPEELARIRTEDLWEGVMRIQLPAREWKRITGDAGWANQPHRLASPVGWLAEDLSPAEMLRLMGESTALLEAAQRGKSWLMPLEVGGPANPVTKDSWWSGRVPWRNPASPSGLRSVLRIELCRGVVPSGRMEEILLARTGEVAKAAGRGEATAKVDTRLPMPGHAATRSTPIPARRKRMVFLGLGMGLLIGAGLAWWGLIRHGGAMPELTGKGEANEGTLAKVRSAGSPLPPVPEMPTGTPVRHLAGEVLRQSLWTEAGGREAVAGLHLLFGKPSVPGVIEDEVELVLREGANPASLRGPDGVLSLVAGDERKKFCRDASKRRDPWTVFVPESRRGLAYLPAPAERGETRRLAAQELSPEEILEEIGHSIFLSSDRWSLLIRLPPWGEQQFMPVRVVGGEKNGVWMERLDQHRAQLRQMRQEALQRLTPWLGQDPSLWDEEKIQKISRLIPSGPAAGVFENFKRLDEEIRQWWLPPEATATPGAIFRKLLEHPATVCELQLDELVIGRVVP